MLETIANANPNIKTEVELQIAIADLCPESHEPQPGSTVKVCYTPQDRLIELKSFRQYVPSLSERGALDLETFTQMIAQDCARLLGVPVKASGHFCLQHGVIMDVTANAP